MYLNLVTISIFFELRNGLCVRFCHQGILLPNGTCIECPSGHVFNGEKCIQRYCEQGTTTTQTGCVPTCKFDEVLHNGVCVPINCPYGFDARDGRCQPICPGPHFKFENGRCVQTVTCGPGYVKHGESCVPITCPPYTELIGGQCVMKPVQCPNGYEWSNNRCVPTCGSGMILKNGRCEYDGIPCGSDSDFVEGRCVPRGCPPGFERDKDGNCQWIVSTPSPCPNGFIYQNGQCFKDLGTQPQPTCPLGHTRDFSGRCVPLVCPPGTHLVNQNCIRFSCAPGFYYDNNECYPLPNPTPVPIPTSNCTFTSTGHGCIDSQGGVSTINNYNIIEHPTNISVMNVNTIGVYLGACKNGQIKTVVISGNGTEKVDCEEDRTENEVITNEINVDDQVMQSDDDGDEQTTKCCNVISPRVCEKRDNEWVCFNRKRFRCGSFCTAKTVVLSPSRRGKSYKG